MFVLHGKTPYQYQLGSSHTGVPHSTSLNAQRLAVTLRHCVHVVQPHVKAAAIPGARKAAATIVVTAATPEIEGMSQQPMGNMSIYSLYIPGNPKASFFFPSFGVDTFFVITGVLVRLKARSEEPKYGLLTNAREVEKTFGILLSFYQHFLAFFLANCRVKCVFGQLWPKVNQIDMFFSIKCYLCSVKMKQAHTIC